VDGEIQLNDAGRLVRASWQGLSSRFADISLDAFVVMPNHIHGIIVVGVQFIAPSDAPGKNQGAINCGPTLGQIVRTYKASSTRIIRSTENRSFAWQRNYYEHVIRNEESLSEFDSIFWTIQRDGIWTGTIPRLRLRSRRMRGKRTAEGFAESTSGQIMHVENSKWGEIFFATLS
jgi:REP element-mobilizing transposase RayT